MTQPLLSICIPTFNRAQYLEECLSSINIDGNTGDVEVVVSDNASTDDTVEVLKAFEGKLPLRWMVQQENIGAERNFHSLIHFAKGRYCWLLGSDDCLKHDSIPVVLQALQSRSPDILHFGYTQADIGLNPLYDATPRESEIPANASYSAVADYFDSQPNVSLLLAFISSFIFKRSIWVAPPDRVSKWFGSNYVHLFVIHQAIADGATVAALPTPAVIARGDNPNEFNSVAGRFIALDSSTLTRLCREIYAGDAQILKSFGRVFRRSYPNRAVLNIASQGGLEYLQRHRADLVALGVASSMLALTPVLQRTGAINLLKLFSRLAKRLAAHTASMLKTVH